MIDIDTVEQMHNVLIELYGGSKGIRDLGSLEAAINRPFVTFDLQDLYPSASEKSAAIFESLIINHPFIDGNKRIAYVMLRWTLLRDGYDINVSQEEKYALVISASTGDVRFDDILKWIKERIAPTNP